MLQVGHEAFEQNAGGGFPNESGFGAGFNPFDIFGNLNNDVITSSLASYCIFCFMFVFCSLFVCLLINICLDCDPRGINVHIWNKIIWKAMVQQDAEDTGKLCHML